MRTAGRSACESSWPTGKSCTNVSCQGQLETSVLRISPWVLSLVMAPCIWGGCRGFQNSNAMFPVHGRKASGASQWSPLPRFCERTSYKCPQSISSKRLGHCLQSARSSHIRAQAPRGRYCLSVSFRAGPQVSRQEPGM